MTVATGARIVPPGRNGGIVMGCLRGFTAVVLAVGAGLLLGCVDPNERLHYVGDANLEYYKDEATRIAYPCVHAPTDPEVLSSAPPRTVADLQHDQIRDIPLMEALHLALANNRIILQGGQAGFISKTALTNPTQVASVYDIAIQESGILFGGRGVEAALSDFDTTFNTTMNWMRDERIQNSPFTVGVPGGTLQTDTAMFNAQLQKQLATGGQFTLTHLWDYRGVNSSAVLFPSVYTGEVRAGYRQPLLAGSGVEYTRIAGPANPNFGAITGVSQGVVIARINNDITIADFEQAVRTGLRDVEDAYWDLYLQYRLYDTAVTARNSALQTWRETKIKIDLGGVRNLKPADEAQARDQYFQARATAQSALSNLYTAEVNLRRLLGLPINDGAILRPVDEPLTAEFRPDWQLSLIDALTHRPELRRQKWNIKSLELQLHAAESLVRPRLDFVSDYHVNAFGDTLLEYDDNDVQNTPQGLNSAYETLTQGDQTGWTLGFEFSMPIGFRSALSQVRNLQLRLAKGREVLAVQEREVSHDVAVALQNLAVQYQTAQSNFNRRQAAQTRVDLFEAELEIGTATPDLVLRAQASLADADRAYYQSLVDYSQAINEFHFVTGTLLENNNIHLEEDRWKPAAYSEALRRAWARSHAFDNPLLNQEPDGFVDPGLGGRTELPILHKATVNAPDATLPDAALIDESSTHFEGEGTPVDPDAADRKTTLPPTPDKANDDPDARPLDLDLNGDVDGQRDSRVRPKKLELDNGLGDRNASAGIRRRIPLERSDSLEPTPAWVGDLIHRTSAER